MNIQLLDNKIDAAVQIIDMFEEILISGVFITKEEMANALGNGVLTLFSDIVECYSSSRMDKLEDQTQFWMLQLERNIEAIEKGDIFYLIDVLVIETKQALIEFQKNLNKVGMVVGEEIYE